MVFQQLSFNIQIEQNKENTSNANLPQTTKKDTNKNRQNTENSYKSTNLEKIRNLDYILTAEKHINHSKENNKTDLAKKINSPEDELEKVIEELKKAEEERKEAEKILWETLSDIIPENLRKKLDNIF